MRYTQVVENERSGSYGTGYGILLHSDTAQEICRLHHPAAAGAGPELRDDVLYHLCGQAPGLHPKPAHRGPSELTQRLQLDWGHSQRSLTKLAEDGFLTKEKSGRSYHLELTEKGRTAFAVCHRVFYDWDARNLTGLTADEQRQLLELLHKAAQKGSM